MPLLLSRKLPADFYLGESIDCILDEYLHIQSCIRLHRKKSLMRREVIKIQCLIRVFISKMRARHRRRIRNSVRLIARNLFRLSKLRQFYQRRKYQRSIWKFVVTIQRLWRRCLGRRRFHSFKEKQRTKEEIAAFLKQRQLKLQSSVELRIFVDTINR